MSKLPPSWVRARLATIADVQLGRQRSPKNHTGPNMRPYLRAANVTWNGLALDDVKEMNFPPSEVATFRLASGDILLSEASGSASEVGKPAMWRNEINDCCFQNTLLRVRTRYLESAYLFWFFKWLALSGQFARGSRGVGIHHLGAKALSEWNVPVPPLPEQDRIVAAIEEQFSRLDAGVAALERVHQNLKRMRSAILQRAVTAPVGTPSVFARDLFSWASGKRAQSAGSTSGQFPVFGGNGIIGHSIKSLKAEETIVIGRVGALCGNVYLTGGPAWITDNAIYAQSHAESLLLPYAVLVFRSARLRDRAAGTGQPFVNQVILNEVTVPLPSKERQADIVARHNAMEEAIFHIEDQLQTLNQRQIGLRSSILAAAFSGSFVAQDPEDESASVLLERISAERTASNGHKPTRTRKPRAPGERITA